MNSEEGRSQDAARRIHTTAKAQTGPPSKGTFYGLDCPIWLPSLLRRDSSKVKPLRCTEVCQAWKTCLHILRRVPNVYPPHESCYEHCNEGCQMRTLACDRIVISIAT